MGLRFSAVEMYRPIEEARYGDVVCLDPSLPGVKNDTRWLFLARDDDVITLMVVNSYSWSGAIVAMPAQGFVVVRS